MNIYVHLIDVFIAFYVKMYEGPPFASNITITGSTNSQAKINDILSCFADTIPPTTQYQWMDPTGSVQQNPNITVLNAGTGLTYICTATNSLGSGTKSIMINVASPQSSAVTQATTMNLVTSQPSSGFNLIQSSQLKSPRFIIK